MRDPHLVVTVTAEIVQGDPEDYGHTSVKLAEEMMSFQGYPRGEPLTRVIELCRQLPRDILMVVEGEG
jgi:hypothetical protein